MVGKRSTVLPATGKKTTVLATEGVVQVVLDASIKKGTDKRSFSKRFYVVSFVCRQILLVPAETSSRNRAIHEKFRGSLL